MSYIFSLKMTGMLILPELALKVNCLLYLIEKVVRSQAIQIAN